MGDGRRAEGCGGWMRDEGGGRRDGMMTEGEMDDGMREGRMGVFWGMGGGGLLGRMRMRRMMG